MYKKIQRSWNTVAVIDVKAGFIYHLIEHTPSLKISSDIIVTIQYSHNIAGIL